MNVDNDQVSFIVENSENNCICKIPNTLYVLWLTKKLFDICLTINSHRYECHKIALIAHCSAIQSKLLNANADEEITEISLFYATKRGIDFVLMYIYKLEISIDIFNFSDILISAVELGIIDVIEMCETYIENYLENIKYQQLSKGGDGDNNYNRENLEALVLALETLYPLKSYIYYRKFELLLQCKTHFAIKFQII